MLATANTGESSGEVLEGPRGGSDAREAGKEGKACAVPASTCLKVPPGPRQDKKLCSRGKDILLLANKYFGSELNADGIERKGCKQSKKLQ